MGLNPDGQPINTAFNRARRFDRDCSELLGLVKGVLADGVVTQPEAMLLREWVSNHPDSAGTWPMSRLKERIDRVFADGKVDVGERRDLSELLEMIVGGTAGMVAGTDAATELPLDRPPPQISWSGSIFVFTGKFVFGPRSACERQVTSLGGHAEKSITKRTRYLVLGTFASRDWIQTSFGRKIEKAVEYRDAGVPLAIVGEDHWATSLL